MNGVVITPLEERQDARGRVYYPELSAALLRRSHVSLHFGTVAPGHTRGSHLHRETIEVLFVLHRDRWTLITGIAEKAFPGFGAERIEISPMIDHTIRNDGAEELQFFVIWSSDGPGTDVEPLHRQ